jgi:hypothetical protein
MSNLTLRTAAVFTVFLIRGVVPAHAAIAWSGPAELLPINPVAGFTFDMSGLGIVDTADGFDIVHVFSASYAGTEGPSGGTFLFQATRFMGDVPLQANDFAHLNGTVSTTGILLVNYISNQTILTYGGNCNQIYSSTEYSVTGLSGAFSGPSTGSAAPCNANQLTQALFVGFTALGAGAGTITIDFGNNSSGSSAVAAVPEPSAALFSAFGLALVLARRSFARR